MQVSKLSQHDSFTFHRSRNLDKSRKRNKETCHVCKRFVNALIEKHVDVNLMDHHAMRTPLEVAASCGCISAIKLLVEMVLKSEFAQRPRQYST